MGSFYQALSLGLGFWVFTYGVNRVYLWAKGMVS